MTRINLIQPEHLMDAHLFAEFREITRPINAVIKRTVNLSNIPDANTIRSNDNPELGKGHVSFFYNKLLFLLNRYDHLYEELQKRDYNVTFHHFDLSSIGSSLLQDYTPTKSAIRANIKRILEQFPKNQRFLGDTIDFETYKTFLELEYAR